MWAWEVWFTDSKQFKKIDVSSVSLQFDLGFSDQGKEKQIRLYQKLLFLLRNKS